MQTRAERRLQSGRDVAARAQACGDAKRPARGGRSDSGDGLRGIRLVLLVGGASSAACRGDDATAIPSHAVHAIVLPEEGGDRGEADEAEVKSVKRAAVAAYLKMIGHAIDAQAAANVKWQALKRDRLKEDPRHPVEMLALSSQDPEPPFEYDARFTAFAAQGMPEPYTIPVYDTLQAAWQEFVDGAAGQEFADAAAVGGGGGDARAKERGSGRDRKRTERGVLTSPEQYPKRPKRCRSIHTALWNTQYYHVAFCSPHRRGPGRVAARLPVWARLASLVLTSGTADRRRGHGRPGGSAALQKRRESTTAVSLCGEGAV